MKFYKSISIYGVIGEFPNRSIDIIDKINAHSGNLDILLNSMGGSIDDTFEVIDYINNLPETRRSELRLICLSSSSSASVYFLECLMINVIISKLTMFHIHEPCININEDDTINFNNRKYKESKMPCNLVMSYIEIIDSNKFIRLEKFEK